MWNLYHVLTISLKHLAGQVLLLAMMIVGHGLVILTKQATEVAAYTLVTRTMSKPANNVLSVSSTMAW